MAAPIAVDHAQVRMLALSVGVREAARQLGIPEKTVLHWSHTEEWFKQPEPKPLPITLLPRSVGSVSPADLLLNTLVDDSKETRLSLSRGARKMASKLEDSAPDQAGNLLQVAKTAALVHGWENGQQSNVRIAIFTASGDQGPVVDI